MNETNKVKVMLAEDKALDRALIKRTVESMNFEVVAEAKDGEEAVDLYKQFKPDILLLDLDMPNKTGEYVLEEIIKEYPEALIIMLTRFKDPKLVGDCFGLGAANHIPKDAGEEKIKEIIRETWENRFERGK